jgi:hypothetical protein
VIFIKKTPLNALSTTVIGEHIYALLRKEERLFLSILNTDLEVVKTIWSSRGSIGFILKVEGYRVLVNLDDKLYLVEGSEARAVLVATNRRNMFWHATRAENKVFIQEYGEAPTGIYASEDLDNWRRLVTNTDLDKRSRHFHNITYDPYRKWLIATLGDGNLTRVAFSEDLGDSWKSLYKGPWQFVPIVPLKDKIVFGMDSGIAKSGLGIYYPDEDRWEFIFLRWNDENIKHTQFCDLKFLDKGLWIASLGTPQAIVASKDLRTWYPLFLESFDKEFNHNMLLSVEKSIITCSTGKTLLVFDENEIENVFTLKPVMVECKAYWDKLLGYGFLIKHSILSKLR